MSQTTDARIAELVERMTHVRYGVELMANALFAHPEEHELELAIDTFVITLEELRALVPDPLLHQMHPNTPKPEIPDERKARPNG